MIEANEYVRTKDGIIGKVIKVLSNRVFLNSLGYAMLINDILKHSKQLMDLIEVGDYVNGLEVEQVLKVREFKGFRGSKKFAFTHIKFSLPGGMIEDKEIRTILTKEQFEANCYKVGGEDEC